MATDTLSPPSTAASASRPAPETAAVASSVPAPAPHLVADGNALAVANPLTVRVKIIEPGQEPIYDPLPDQTRRPGKNGYQFSGQTRKARLTFEIVEDPQDHFAFCGCALAPVESTPGSHFSMPDSCRYTIIDEHKMVVDFTFTPGNVEQVAVLPQYRYREGKLFSFDPQVGNDGGNIAPPPAPMPECDDTHGA